MAQVRLALRSGLGALKMVGLFCLAIVWIVPGLSLQVWAQGSQGAEKPGHDKEFYRHWAVRATIGHSETVVVPFDLEDPAQPVKLSANAKSQDGRLTITLKEYLPDAKITTSAQKDPSGEGGPAVKLLLKMADRSMERWLAADDPDHNELPAPVSLAYVRLLGKRTLDDEIRYLEALASFKPTLVVKDASGSRRPDAFPLEEGSGVILDDGAIEIRVRKLLSDFIMDKDTGELGSRSSDIKNPAVILDVVSGGKSQEAILFSLLPGFSKNAEIAGKKLELHWPVPDTRPRLERMLLVEGAEGDLDILISRRGSVEKQKVTLGEEIPIGGASVTLTVRERLASSLIHTEAQNASNVLRKPAVCVQIVREKAEPEQFWVTVSRPLTKNLPGGTLRIQLGPRSLEKKSDE